MMSIYWKKMGVFVGVLLLGIAAQAACPQGWSYYKNQKACQYFAPNVLAISCSKVANSSWTASQTCVQVGNCRSSFIPKCQRMQDSCRTDIAKKCNNDAACIKATKCPGQFVVEGVVQSTSTAEVTPVKDNSSSGGGAGQGNGNGNSNGVSGGTGSGNGTVKYSGGLGTGEGY